MSHSSSIVPKCKLRMRLRSAQGARHGACDESERYSQELAASVEHDYSITGSARNTSVCGIVRPSAFAVLRLITSSNFVGFAPVAGLRSGAPSSTRPSLRKARTRTIRVEDLPARWPGRPAPEELAALGTDWVARGTS
jgi:hypothetical protein